MKKLNLISSALLTAVLSTSIAYGDMANTQGQEKCEVKDAQGNNQVMAGKGDGVLAKDGNNKGAFENDAGETGTWIWVPTGECDNIQKGQFDKVSDATKAKINMDALMSTAAPAPAAK